MEAHSKINDIYPLSPMQSGLLFHNLYAPESDAYFVQSVFELEGEIDISCLESAWQKVVNHHPILRTGFIWQDGDSPLQYILESVEIPFNVEDWQDLKVQEREERLNEFIQKDRKQAFNLSKPPLLRLVLIQYDVNKYYFVWSQHHILTDGWCLPIILKDVFQTYEDIRQKREVRLKAPRPYRDYIGWLQKQDLDRAKIFWKDYLAPVEEPTRLSFKNIITENKVKDYNTYSISLSIEETEAIKKFAGTNHLTLNTIIQGAVGTVLRMYTQQQNVIMGITVSGRNIDLPGIDEMIGVFINTLPLIITHIPGETNLSFLKNLQVQTQQLNDYTFVPLAQIQSWSRTDKSLFDIIFVFENYPLGENTHTTDPSFIIKNVKSIEKTEYPLSITVVADRQLHLTLNYQTAHFNEEIIERFSNHIRQVLQGIIQDTMNLLPTPILELPLLTPQEQHQVLVEWNATKVAYPKAKIIHQLFEEQVDKTPHNTAVVYEDMELTYQQLNEKSNQLARYLRKMEVGPDTRVAIAVERSLEMIIVLLGILKAGGAYVPLDTSYPEERLRYMLGDAKALIVITDINTICKIPSTLAHVICLDDEWEYIKSLPSDNLEHSISPYNLAYVIYTSGSTGKPKGVMVDHGNLSHYLNYAKKEYFLSPGASLLHSSIAFDMSITSIFLPFVVGNSIHVLSKDLQIDSFEKILNNQNDRFGFIKISPSHLKALKDQLCPKTIQKQKGSLIIGGENLLKEDLKFWVDASSDAHIFNEYGPTETTVGCCVFELNNYTILSSSTIPIGRPINNTQIYILDTYLNAVPIGISGEIYIGGAGLTRGYLNRPDLTAERFIPNPFIQKNSQENQYMRLYRTGDLARYLPDSNIEFLGRMDDQVKIRGFRIELGEIESSLKRHGDVAQVVVIAREDDPGDRKLVAYVVPGDFTPLNTELKDFLLEMLPDYMVPSFFIFLDKIPLTSNGKIDRKSLPAPNLTLRQVSDAYVAPQSQLEQELSSIWLEVLKIENISIHDNFFSLGGHSLLATQVISRIRHIYSIDIPLRTLFEHPTIATLSKIVDALRKQNVLSLIPPIIARKEKDFIPLSFAQQRLWFLAKLLPNITLYNIHIGFKLVGDLNLAALEKAFNTLITRHESLRTIFPETERNPYQLILSTLNFNLAQSSQDLTHLNKEARDSAIERLAENEANTRFNLATGPLMSIKLVVLSKKEHVLLITLHHIIFDGWSMGIFFRELCSLYNAFCLAQESPLPSLSLQYPDFAIWQRDWLQGEVLRQQLSYWKQQLSDIPDLLELPADKSRPKELTYQGAAYDHTLSKEIKDGLNKLSQSHNSSLFMILLAAFQVLLYRYTGQKDIVVGSPIANRHHKETETLIGFFVNTLALRTTFEGNESFLDVLNKVKETTLQAYQHQDVPFEQLVDHLNVTRELNRNPIFQVMFTFQNMENISLPFKDLIINSLHSSYPVAKFDLSFNICEHGDGIAININYATDLFELKTIERLVLHFKELIHAIVKNPSQSIHTYPLLTYEEQHQLTVEWNATKTNYPQDKSIHQLFEEQVRKAPYNIAVVYEEQELTYEQLNEKSNQLAHYLRTLGVGPDTLVAIVSEKCLEMVIGLLGVLKAGGAYVPLDSTYPQERLQFMLKDINAKVLITQSHLQSTLNEMLSSYTGKTIFLDQIETYLSQQSTDNPISISRPYHLAYVIYTSGSTGQPKGVMIEHKSIRNYIFWRKSTYDFSAKDKVLQRTAISFDASVWEIFVTLLNGAQLYLPPTDINKDLNILGKIITDNIISSTQFVPSMAKAFVVSFNTSSLYSLKYLTLGGEVIERSLWQSLGNNFPGKLLNTYGPTEITIDAASYKYSKEEDYFHLNTIPIGKPIANAEIYILDGEMQPVPIGVRGEIYIGGEGLARGYLNRPELTAERFVPNPFAGKYIDLENALPSDTEPSLSSLRLYKTGDIARYLPDGNIEFLGRSDDQVKIRGFRIECGEIQTALSAHGEVASSLIIPREDEQGHKRLIAYVIPKNMDSFKEESVLTSSTGESFKRLIDTREGNSFTEELRTHLTTSLPDYMIPAFFVLVDRFPLTPNGKIDKASLPDPDLSLREETFVAPRTKIEEDLSHIWSEVLGISPISIHDNFFRIGGDSIISIQIVSKARQRGIPLTVKDIFAAPTISGLAAQALVAKDTFLAPTQGELQGPLPLTPIQSWFFERDLKEENHYNQATLLKLNHKLSPQQLKDALSLLLQHHDILRASYHYDSNTWIQSYLPVSAHDALHFFLEKDLSLFTGEDFDLKIHEEATKAQESLHIDQGILLKAVLFHGDEKRGDRLLLVIHHLAVDGVSWRILLDDLQMLLEGTPLPPKTHAYRDWGETLKIYVQSEEALKELPYWAKVEESLSPLSTDFPQSKTPLYAAQNVSLTKNETTLLLREVPKAYRTEINDVLLTALTLAIGDWSKDYTLSLLLEGHGREDLSQALDISRTIGWFTSIFPVSLHLSDPSQIGECLKSVKEQLRSIPKKGIGYGILRYLHKESPLRAPLPRLSFNYLGQWDTTLQEEGIFSFAKESSGNASSPLNTEESFLNLNGSVQDGIFFLSFGYDQSLYKEETIRAITTAFLKRLREIIEHTTSKNVFGYTPSDFPLISLSQKKLDHTFAHFHNLQEIYPLSPLQAGLLFQALYAPTSDAYFVQNIWKIEGKLDHHRLQKAWQTLMDHHPTLRTGVLWDGLDKPLQYVLSSLSVPFTYLDWTKQDTKEVHQEEQEKSLEERLEDFIQADRRQGFDLSKAPLFRVTLIKTHKECYTLLWSQHHILTDGWTLPILMNDLFNAYQGKSITVPRRPYKDYIAWLQRQDMDKAEAFWKDTLKGLDGPTRLPFKGIIEENQEKDYDYHPFTLSLEETNHLKSFAQKHGLTLNTLFQGAVGKVLQTYAQNPDVVLGINLSGRAIDLSGVEDMVGLFINTLPLRIPSAKTTPLDFLKQLQEQTQHLNEYDYTPLAQIQSWTGESKGLFDVLFIFENYPIKTTTLNEKEDVILKMGWGLEKTEYPLTIAVGPSKELSVHLSYQTEYFDQAQVIRLEEHIRRALEGLTREDETLVYLLPLLSASEEEQLLLTWNDTTKDYPREKTIHQLFEEQVQKTPHNIAVVYEDESLTYKVLNEKANQLAHLLRAQGVGPDTLVAIAMDRSLEMIIGLLGILKAGGAYVPLDPDYPSDRLQFMLEDTNAPLLITQSFLKDKLGPLLNSYQGSTLFLDQALNDDLNFFYENEANKTLVKDSTDLGCTQPLSSYPKQNLTPLATPLNLAYVIYTSGSTGKPKGVEIEHKEVVNYIYYNLNQYDSPSFGTTLLHSSIVFDMSITSLFFPLSRGDTLSLLQREHKTENILLSLKKNQDITYIKLTPAHLQILKEDLPNLLSQQRRFIIGGESLLQEDIMPYLKEDFSSNNLIINEYGPTEATVGCSVFAITSSTSLPSFSSTIPIGKPIANAEIYILDGEMQPVPIGVRGEIYIGGEGLARGYLNRPELTAERFVPNPFAGKYIDLENALPSDTEPSLSSLRLYKTGDIARYLPDGNIEFLGRSDDQVKIRGFRIECGEIQTALSAHGEVASSLIIPREDEQGHKRLIAYVIPKNMDSFKEESVLTSSTGESFKRLIDTREGNSFTEELRTHLTTSLPDYMIPAFFVLVDRFPLTPNGKIDKASLPDPDLSLREETFVAPRTKIEEDLSHIWSEVLGISPISIHDNFFRIGGDSIISIQIVSKARQRGIPLTVKDIFAAPTISGLAAQALVAKDTFLAPTQGELQGPLPLTPIQSWFFERDLKEENHYNQATLLKLNHKLSPQQLKDALSLLLQHHDILRASYHYDSNTWIQSYLPVSAHDALHFFLEKDLSLFTGEDFDLKIHEEATKAQESLHIDQGILLKAVLFHGDEKRGDRLLLVIHHLAVDGVSWRILLDDLQMLLEGTPLPPKTHAYRDWGETLKIYVQSEEALKELPYWAKVEESLSPLSTDFPQSKTPLYAAQNVSLTKNETTLLLREVPKAYRTEINDVLLTALTLAIGDWSKDYTLSLLLEGHGREDLSQALDISRTIGWFTSIFPVSLHLSDPSQIGECLKSVKEQLRSIPKKGIGYGILRYLHKESPLRAPLPRLSFNYLGQWDTTLQEEGIFSFAKESSGNASSPLNTEESFLNLNGSVQDGIFFLSFGYDQSLYKEETIRAITTAFLKRLREIIEHTTSKNVFGYTPSDFPLISLSQKKLDHTFAHFHNLQEIYPLSPLQAGLLFQALYAPTSDAYFVQNIWKIEGKLDHHRLQKAWQTLMDHHPTLRTGVLWDGLDKPLQYVLSSLSVPFTYLDWTKQDTKEVHQEEQEKSLEERLEDFIQADRRQGFDLSKAPLFRVTLIKTHKECYTLLWSQHHILTDGWTLPILMNDLFNAYQGKSITVPRRPYKDYIAWLQRQDMDKAEAFWKDTLKGLDGPTRLPFKGIIEENQEKDYDYHPFTLSLEETNHLKSFAQKHGLTLNTLFQGAVGKVLQTYAQNPDVVLGINLSGRAIDLSGVEDMVGLFINTLPLRIPSAKTTPLDFLKQLQEQTQHLNEYDYTPLAQIQSWTGESKGLFDVVLAFENYPIQDNILSKNKDVVFTGKGVIEKSEYPLTIAVIPGKELSVHLSYQTEYFDQAQVIRLEEHIRRALEGLTREDETLVYLLPLLSASEEEQLLLTWNDTTKDYPREKTIHQLFEEQVQKTPHNIAVVYEDESLTYKALNEKANQLAHLLRAQGVGPDTLVAIAMDRSLEMIIGLLGILKAGGAYVPLDPEYPSDRLQFMLEDTNVPFIITDTKNINKLPSTWAQLICLDDQNTPINQYSTTNLTPLATPLNLAYIIYTSGSTGKPKGAGVQIFSIINVLHHMDNIAFQKPGDYFIHNISFSFDPSVWAVFWPLVKGSTVVVLSQDKMHAPKAIIEVMQKYPSSVMHAGPALLSILLEDLEFKDCAPLQSIIGGGEAWKKTLVDTLHNHLPRCTLSNVYGPTETAIHVTTWPCVKDHGISLNTIPIGKPIANAEIYILDGEMQPVPIGVRGEIYIGGEGLARGYLNRPELTAERFVPNPFAGKYIDLENALPSDTEPSLSSLRLYKTGDIARYLPDGNIEFLGRSDDQVKIRGFRIECGEIQTALSAHGEVASSLIIPREDEQGHKRLIAYVIPKNMDSFKEESVLTSSTGESFKRLIDTREGNSFTEELRTHLTTSLPDYMIPAFFVLVDRFPLTPNGKIDKASLPDPDLSLREETFVAPRTKIEEDLSHIWSEVLGISPISIHDNFFNIGGHSLLATQVISRINGVVAKQFSLIDLFNYPTISMLSSLISSDVKLGAASPVLTIQQGKVHMPSLFMIHPGGGFSYCYVGLSKYIKDFSIYGINNPNLYNPNINLTSIKDMAQRYIHLIKEIQSKGPYLLGGWSLGGVIGYEIAQQLYAAGDEVEILLLIDSVLPNNKQDQQNDIEKTPDEELENEDDFYIEEQVRKLLKTNLKESAKLVETYTPEKYLQHGAVVLLKAEDSIAEYVHQNHADHKELISQITVETVPGTHATLFDIHHLENTSLKIYDNIQKFRRGTINK